MIWFTSDLHFFHSNILKYSRPNLLSNEEYALWMAKEKFKTSEDSIAKMNTLIIDTINKYVKSEDELWHLGDFIVFYAKKGTFREIYKERFEEITSKINCKNLYFVKGNHEPPEDIFPGKLNDVKLLSTRYGHFWLSHYAHLTWPEKSKGCISLHGHFHGTAYESISKILPNIRNFDCGVDVAYRMFGEYRPFSANEIIKIMSSKTGEDFGHH